MNKYLHKMLSVMVIFSLMITALPMQTVQAAGTCTWTGSIDTNWGTSGNWDCNHIPTVGDIVVFSGSNPTVTGVSTATIAALQVTNNAAVTMSAAAAAILTINGGSTGFQVDSGSSLTLSGANAISLTLSGSTIGTISGSMTVAGGGHRLIAASSTYPITFQNGASFTTGTSFSGNVFGTTNLNSIIFASGSTYVHKSGSNPFGASQPNSVITFQSGSTYSQQATSGASFSGRTFANFELNLTGGTITATGGNPLSVDNLTVTNGTLNMNMTGTFNLRGNVSVASGASLSFSSGSPATITLNGTSQQTFDGSGTLTFAANETVDLNNSNGLLLQRNVTLSGPLTLTSGDIITQANTLTLAGIVTGSGGEVIGNVKRTGPFTTGTDYPFNNANTSINFGSGTLPTDITITLTKGAPAGGLANAIARIYSITANGDSSFSAALKLGYNQSEVGSLNELALRPWKNISATWTEQPGIVNTGNDYVSALGVTSFSDWAIAESTSPLPTDPSGAGSASPSTLPANYQTLLSVAVTPGTNPASTNLEVTCNLSNIGGPASQAFYDDGTNGDVTTGDNTFSYLTTVASVTTDGAKSLPCTITDTNVEHSSGSTAISLTIIAVLPIGMVNGVVNDGDDGTTHLSPYVPASSENIIYGDYVYVQGVIYETTLQAIKGSTNTYKGFFIQNTATTADTDSKTSDGLFVFMGTNSTIAGPSGNYTPTVGDEVILYGQVEEYYHMTEFVNPVLFMPVLRSGVNLETEVAPIEANPPDNLADANRYWERLQGMRIQAPVDSLVLGGRGVFSPADAEIWLARPDSTVAQRTDPYTNRAFRDAHSLDDNYDASNWDGNGYRILIGSLGIKAAAGDGQVLINPARTFSTLTNALVGGLNYTFNKYRIEVTAQPIFSEGLDPAANNPPTAIIDRSVDYSIADYNLENLYDYRDNPFSGCDFSGNTGCSAVAPFKSGVTPPYDYVPASNADYQSRLNDIALQIINNLHNPDIVMVQEVENQDICTVISGALVCGTSDNADGKPDVLQELALKIATNGGPTYDAAWDRDSSDLRGIAPSFLYRTNRVQLVSPTGNPVLGAAPTVTGYTGVSYNSNVSNPKTLNAVLPSGITACETNWVFPRAVDVGLFRIYSSSVGVGTYHDIYLLNNHFKSGPDSCVGHRTEQAEYNAALIDFIQTHDAGARIIMGGDLNVYPRPDDVSYGGDDQLGSLYAPALGLKNLWEVVNDEAPESAYSYVYLGMAQTLDQMFVNAPVLADLHEARIAHINSDFPADYPAPGDVARGTSDHDPTAAQIALLPGLDIAGFTADSTTMAFENGKYILPTSNDGTVDHEIQFSAGSTASEALDGLVGLYLDPTGVNTAALEAYYRTRIPEGSSAELLAYRDYLIGALDGQTNPFAYITTDDSNNIILHDAAKYDLAGNLTSGMIIPDNYPLGVYTVHGTARDISGNEAPVTLTLKVDSAYTLQLLHASDWEAGLAASQDAPNFAAIVDYFDNTYSNTVLLSSGDNYIPGPFFNAGGDPAMNTVLGVASVGRADMEVLNRIGIEASVFGNHDFDAGTKEVSNIIVSSGAWRGAQFPYLSSNLNFAGDSNLSGLVRSADQEASTIKGKIAPSAMLTKGGEKIGLVGVTTPMLASISSPGGVVVNPPSAQDMQTLAKDFVQPAIDALVASGANKIIVLSHLQQISYEEALGPMLHDVDIIIAGGSNTILKDANDRLRTGDTSVDTYPLSFTNADGDPGLIVNTDGTYRYVGRLVIGFDANGIVRPESYSETESGVYATDTQGVQALWGNTTTPFLSGTKGYAVKQVTDAIASIINTKDAVIYGHAEVYLNGLRTEVRTEETNLGNMTADANLAAAQIYQASHTGTETTPVTVSIKNGGGVRDSIGSTEDVLDENGNVIGVNRVKTVANPAASKNAGDISKLDIENSLRFNNDLSMVTISAADLKIILEHSVAAVAPGATPGQFPQIGGIAFSYDPTRTAQVLTGNPGIGVATVTTPGQRIRSVVRINASGQVVEKIVENGVVVGFPLRLFRLVTLRYMVEDGSNNDGLGGDNYPFPSFDIYRVDMGVFEQTALSTYLTAQYPVGGSAYNIADTPATLDTRIENLQKRPDTIIPNYTISGNAGVSGATITYDGGTTTADSSGNYTFTVSYGWTGDITPTKTGFTFTPASIPVSTGVTANLSNQNFNAADTGAPAINSFTATTPVHSLTIPITAFTSSDNVAVTGYLITTTSTPPASGAAGWSSTAPTSYAVAGPGTYMLYPWAKDAAGNVSAAFGSGVSVVVKLQAIIADFNGDGKTDVAVYRPSAGTWYVKDQFFTNYGLPGDIPIPGDYNADGKTDVAVYRPSAGTWYVKDQFYTGYGLPGDIPIPGDYNGDGKTDVAVYRPSAGTWYIKDQFYTGYGLPGDIPIPGDYNGDGKTDVAVYRPSAGTWYVKDQFFTNYGLPGDIPIPGDYNGDGKTDVAVYRPSQGTWYIKDQFYTGYGLVDDIAIPGDYNGDGKTDVAVYRPSAGTWYIKDQFYTGYGLTGDIPLPEMSTGKASTAP